MAVTDEAAAPDELTRLASVLRPLRRVVVAFSGGADSSLVAYVATRQLGGANVLCATADSASLAGEERAACRRLAGEWGLRHVFVRTDELDDPDYVANGLDRCYHCKKSLMDELAPLAHAEDATVVLGVNVDDLAEHRPGQRAAAEAGARFPLVEAGLRKDRVRHLSQLLGLQTWDKPAAPCLASRVPHGTPVTLGILGRVEAAESALKRLGYVELRVRHYGDRARVELGPTDLARALGERGVVEDAVRDAGYRLVTIDLAGLRSGNLVRSAVGEGRSKDNG